MTIKLSQYQLIIIEKIPVVFGFCNNKTISLGSKSDALSHLIAKVLGHMKLLFLITISSECVNIKSGWPFPLMINSWVPTEIEKVMFDVGSLSFSFRDGGKSLQPDVALTPTIQSPLGVNLESLVISIVF